MSEKKPSPEATKSQKNISENADHAGNKNSDVKNKTEPQKEIGGFADQNLPEPTRFGDWEVKGRCSDF